MIEMFDVSRPTIREAIRILEFENLISVSRGARGGAVVQPHTPAFVSRAVGVALQSTGATLGDVYAARSVIEPVAARMAAEARPKEAGAILLAHAKQERELLTTEAEIADRVAEFHRLLLTECGNKTFALLGVALHDLVSRHQNLFHRVRPAEGAEDTRKRSSLGVRSHEKLAKLIADGEGAEAEAHWHRHMQRTAELILPGLEQTSVLDVLDKKDWI